MDIAEIDERFKINTNIEINDIVWYNSANKPFEVYGAVGTNPYIRMPLDTAEKVSGAVLSLCRHTAGIRIRFRTDSPYIAIHSEWQGITTMSHMAVTGQAGFDLYSLDFDGIGQSFVGTYIPWRDAEKGFESVLYVKNEMTDYILNFPLYNSVDRLYIGLAGNASFEKPSKYMNELPIVFYGTSITQGGCASRPGNSYQAFLSRMFNIDYVNLGFSGSGRAEDEMISYLAGLSMAAFVSDYDYNADNAGHLGETHDKLYDAVRAKHPDIPYIMLTGSGRTHLAERDKRRQIIMNTYSRAIDLGDTNVYFIDGTTLFTGDEWQACTVDNVHPNDMGFYCFAKALYPVLRMVINNKKFGRQ